MRTRPSHLASILLLTSGLGAQTLALQSASQGTLIALSGSQVVTTTTPVGPLPTLSPYNLAASITGSANAVAASMGWAVYGPAGMNFDAYVNLAVAGGGQASAMPGDYLIDLSAPTQGVVTLRLTRTQQSAQPLAMQQVSIDLDDDGVLELSDQTMPQLDYVRALGPVPLRIRVRLQGTLTQPDLAHLAVGITALPGPATSVHTVANACTMVAFQIEPTLFGDQLGLTAECQGNCVPRLFVLGLGLQPQVLPSISPWCGLLLPSPDLVLLAGPGSSSTPTMLALPAAARPIDIYAQAVWVWPNALITTDAFRVAAY